MTTTANQRLLDGAVAAVLCRLPGACAPGAAAAIAEVATAHLERHLAHLRQRYGQTTGRASQGQTTTASTSTTVSSGAGGATDSPAIGLGALSTILPEMLARGSTDEASRPRLAAVTGRIFTAALALLEALASQRSRHSDVTALVAILRPSLAAVPGGEVLLWQAVQSMHAAGPVNQGQAHAVIAALGDLLLPARLVCGRACHSNWADTVCLVFRPVQAQCCARLLLLSNPVHQTHEPGW